MDSQGREPTNGTGDQSRGEGQAVEAVAAVRELVQLMAANGVTELDVTYAGVSIRLRGPGGAVVRVATQIAYQDDDGVASVPATEVIHLVTAPMIGTFYVSPTPNDPPFVAVGDSVEAGQTVGIIEAMKIMNEIVCDIDGIVVEIVAANGRAVEYGSPLLRIAPTAPGDA